MSIRARLTSLSPGQWFIITAAVAVLVKLWLVSEIRTLPYDAPYDASNFAEHAKSIVTGHWFGTYDALALIKGPSFPIYMALVQEFGIPLPLAHQLLYAGACLMACLAIRPLDRRGFALPIIFVVLLFNPFTFATLSWVTYRSQLYESAGLFCLAFAAGIYVRRARPVLQLLPWFIALGSALAVFALTREESVWIVPAMLVAAAAWLAFAWAQRRSELRLRIAILVVPLVIWLGANDTIAFINGVNYGWPTVVEVQSSEFVSAYNALARIDVPNHDRFVTVPRAARLIAYGVSPAARELRQSLDGAGSQGRAWVQVSCNQGFSCTDIPVGWFIWSLRNAVSEAGHYKSGPDARAFYLRLADEIDRACDSGTIRCRRKGRSLSPPVHLDDIPTIAQTFVIGVQKLLTLAPFQLAHWESTPSPARLVADYEFVTRATLPTSGTIFTGWMPHERLKSIRVVDAQGADTHASILFSPSPDIHAYFQHDPLSKREETALARFSIVSTCSSDCSLIVTGERGDVTTIALDMSLRSIRTPHLTFYLDSITSDTAYADFDDGFKGAALATIASLYKLALPFLFFVAAVQLAIRLVAPERLSPGSDHAIVSATALAGAASLLLLLSVVDVIAFPSFTPEYMGAAVPLLLFAVSTTVTIEAEGGSLLAQTRLYAATAVVLLMCLGVARILTPAKASKPAASQAIVSVACPHELVRTGGVASGSLDGATSPNGVISSGAIVPRDVILSFRGWAADGTVAHPVTGVCLLADGAPLAGQQVAYGLDRPDVAQLYGRPALERTGYEIRAPLTSLRTGEHRLEVVGFSENSTGTRLGTVLDVLIR